MKYLQEISKDSKSHLFITSCETHKFHICKERLYPFCQLSSMKTGFHSTVMWQKLARGSPNPPSLPRDTAKHFLVLTMECACHGDQDS